MPDIETPKCNFCDNDATHTCGRCGKPYCDADGRDLCRSCLAPDSALPSEKLFKGSLVALVIAGIVGLWLLVAPPTLPGEHRLAHSSAQNPNLLQPANGNRAGRSGVVPTPKPSDVSSTESRSYTVQLNDTLSGIADSFGSSVAAIQAANPGVTPSTLKAGQQLVIPPPGATPSPTPSPTPAPTPSLTATPELTPSPTPAASPTPGA
jgi:LysM repeat protein